MPITLPDLDVLPGHSLLIGGERRNSSSGDVHTHVYAGNGLTSAKIALGGERDVDDAVVAARAALPAWREVTPPARRNLMLELARLLQRDAARLSQVHVIDSGCPVRMTARAPFGAAEMFEYNAGWVERIVGDVIPTWGVNAFDYSLIEPLGVIAVIIPWNSPLTGVARVIAPALAAGNCVVVKPPELAPFSALALGDLAAEAGFPPGVVNVVPAGPAGGDALVRHPGIDKVHFTGSGETARKILASALENLTPVGLELGGKSANIVFHDSDLDAAATQSMSAVVQLSGQGCINGTRVLVEESVHAELVERCVAISRSVKVGDPVDPSTEMGPVISEGALARIQGVIDDAKKEGAGRLVAGGDRLGGDLADGWFLSPTVFDGVDPASSLASEEIFGPVLSVIPFKDEESAIEIANRSVYGLASYVQTNDLRRAHRMAAALETGMVFVNGFGGLPIGAPFGGRKQSGYGRLGGLAGIMEFSQHKNVWMQM